MKRRLSSSGWRAMIAMALLSCGLRAGVASAAPLPSLFRGVVVADSPLGVRVVSVDDRSQARMADLRPEDIIVRINDLSVRSIDEFAVVSQGFKGKMERATVTILRDGDPRELAMHLYSYPILKQWGLEFIPDDQIRFADANAGVAYWTNMARGFREAGKFPDALSAQLNALHYDITDTSLALGASSLLWQVAQDELNAGRLQNGLSRLDQATTMLNRLFERPLSVEQLTEVKDQLRRALVALQQMKRSIAKPVT